MKDNAINIGFDARPLFRQRDGIGTYTEKIILAAAGQYPDHAFIGVVFRGDLGSPNLIKTVPNNVRFLELPFSWKSYRAKAELGFWKPVDSFIDVPLGMFIYFNFIAMPKISASIPKPLFVHDATYLLYPETMTKRNHYFLSKFVRKSLQQQNVIPYTVSEYSAAVLKERLGRNFKVAYPGPRDLAVNKYINTTGPMLALGTIEPRKNIGRLLDAYNSLDGSIKEKFNLVIAGKIGWESPSIINRIKSTEYVSFIEAPSDKKVEELLAGSSYLLLPSLYEGFGITALEAARKKLAVVTSSPSPMEEFLGKHGAIYCNPIKTDSITSALITATSITNEEKIEMVRHAFRNSDKITWQSSAHILLKEIHE